VRWALTNPLNKGVAMEIKNNQIWQVCDGRMKRFVKVLDDGSESAKVKIVTVFSNYVKEQVQDKIIEISNAVPSYAQQIRFGHPKGYRFIAKNMKEFLEGDNDYTQDLTKGLPVKAVAREPVVISVHSLASIVRGSGPALAEGQVWMANDSRTLRFVKVVDPDVRGSVAIRTVYISGEKGVPLSYVGDDSGVAVRYSQSSVFNGKSKGYTFVAHDLRDFKDKGYESIKHKGLKWSEVLGDFSKESQSAKNENGNRQNTTYVRSASSHPRKLRPGQIWRANDSRSLRYVHIDEVFDNAPGGAGWVKVSTVYSTSTHLGVVEKASKRRNEIGVMSFNGKSKGFSVVADSLDKFLEMGLDRAVYDRDASWSSDPVLAASVLSGGSVTSNGVIEPVTVQRDKAIELGRELVASKQLWQERTNHLHFIEVTSIDGDYAVVTTRYIAKAVNERPEFTKGGRTFEIRLDEFLPAKNKYHHVSSL
jgi:hypothetical protein